MANRRERKSVDRSKLEFADNVPTWIDDLGAPGYSQEVREVIEYFLAYSPCPGLSSRRIALTSCGWPTDTPSKDSLFVRSLLEEADLSLDANYFMRSKREDEIELFSAAEMGSDFCTTTSSNRIALVGNGNLAMDLFRSIRNALAHFRFCLVPKSGSLFLAMENGVPSKQGFEVKARLFLSIEALEAWIELIKDGRARMQAEEKRKEAKQKQLEERLIQAIEAGDVKTQRDVATNLGIKKAEAKRILGNLKDQQRIRYVPQTHRWEVLSHE